MDILFLSSWFPYPPDNGARLRVYNLIRRLAPRHRIALLSFTRDGEPADPAPIAPFCQRIETVPLPPFRPQRLDALVGLFSPQPRSVVATHSQQMAAALAQALQEPCDLVMACEIGPGTGTAPYLTGRERVPCLIEDLELSMIQGKIAAQRTLAGRWRHRLTWWKLQRYAGHLLRHAAGCTVASNEEERLVRRLAPAGLPLAVVPNGLDIGRYDGPFDSPRPHTLIFPGALTYPVNRQAMHFFLSKIFPRLRATDPQLTLSITGSTDHVPSDMLPRQPGVLLTGYLADVRPAIAESWACVVPLREGGGTRLKILEAMALGTPVVATSKGAEGLAVTPEENILIADEPAAFADAVMRLLSDPALRARLAANGRTLVRERYSWEQIGETVEQFLQQLVTQSPRRAA